MTIKRKMKFNGWSVRLTSLMLFFLAPKATGRYCRANCGVNVATVIYWLKMKIIQIFTSVVTIIIGDWFMIVAIFSPYKNTTCRWWICTLFFNCQGTLPWQPNNVTIMKANWYYVHSLHVCYMAAWFRFATIARWQHCGADWAIS